MLSHFVRPLTLSQPGQVEGPFRVGPLGAGFYSGYLGVVPPEWWADLGGPALTGNADLGVITRTSFGPAVFTFDPENMTPTAAQPLVYYDVHHQTLGPWDGANENFSGTDTMRGVMMPVGTNSVLFFGKHGTTFCYGPGTSDPALAGTIGPGMSQPYCYDPLDSSQGVHGYPYHAYVWAYDANELAAVKAGRNNRGRSCRMKRGRCHCPSAASRSVGRPTIRRRGESS